MDPLTKTLIIAAMSALGGGAAVWLLMTLRELRRRIDLLRGEEHRRQDDARSLSEAQTEIVRLKAANEDLSRRAWPGTLNLDQRAWLASITGLQEVAAQDQLDALMRLSPEAVQRVVAKIAPHLFEKVIK